MTKLEFKKICENALVGNTSRIRLFEITKVEPYTNYEHQIIHYWGGNNGNSDWANYLDDINFIIRTLQKDLNEKVRLIKLNNDCPDDIFDLYLGTYTKVN